MSPASVGEVFTLGADGELDGKWNGIEVLRTSAGISGRGTFDAHADLCHGIDFAVGASLSVEAAAAFSAFLAARGEGQAFAAAGVNLRLTLAPDLFRRFGLSGDLGAFAEASVAGRLSVGLDIGQIKAAAGVTLGQGIAFEIFDAFLDELDIEAGVWGRASASAMARAHVDVYISLADDNASGFMFEFGGAVGLEAGTGWDFFASARLRDPRRFLDRTAGIIVTHVVDEARKELPAETGPALDLLDIAVRCAVQIALDVGQAAANGFSSQMSTLRSTVVASVVQELQRYALRKAAELGERLLALLVDEVSDQLAARGLDANTRQTLRAAITALRPLANAELTLDSFPALAEAVLGLATAAAPDEVERWRRPIAIVWTTLAVARALDAPGSRRDTRESMLDGDNSLPDTALDALPTVVREAYDDVFGAAPLAPTVADGITFVLESGFATLAEEFLPDLANLLDLIEDKLGITRVDALESMLRLSLGGDVRGTAIYQKVRDMLHDLIEDQLLATLVPALQAANVPPDEQKAIVDVVMPALTTLERFLLERLDDPSGITSMDEIRQGASLVINAVISRNTIVLGDILLGHTLDSLHDALGELEQRVRSEDAEQLVTAAVAMLPGALPQIASRTMPIDAVRTLVAELLAAAGEAFGPTVWTERRRRALRETLLELVGASMPGMSDVSIDEAQDIVSRLAGCDNVPAPLALQAFGAQLSEITIDELVIVMQRVVPALEEFFLSLTENVVHEIDTTVRGFIDGLAAAADAALRLLRDLERALADASERLRAAAHALSATISTISARLQSAQRRRDILNFLETEGRQLARNGAAAVPGFDLLSIDLQNAALSAATFAFDTAWALAKPVVDLALQAAGFATGIVADLIENAADNADLLANLGTAIVDGVRNELARQLGIFGVLLPKELTPQMIADAAKSLLITDEVEELLVLALSQLRDKRQRDAEERQARADRDAANAALQDARAEHGANISGPIAVQMLSPGEFDSALRHPLVYGRKLTYRIVLKNAKPDFVLPGPGRRVFLALNSTPLPIDVGQLRFDQHRRIVTLVGELVFGRDPLVAGLNLLECSVVDGTKPPKRTALCFAARPDGPAVGDGLRVRDDLSQLDTPDNDHRETTVEFVTIGNDSKATVKLDGWLLLDRARHAFVFPNFQLAPDATVRVHTGDGRNGAEDLFWGQRRAIWNNRGDSVYLVDDRGIVRAEYSY